MPPTPVKHKAADYTRIDTHFCPRCQSPAVDVSEVSGGASSCRVCQYKGTRETFPVYPVITHAGVNATSLLQDLVNALSKALYEPLTQRLLPVLARFGFIPWDTSNGILSTDASERDWQARVLTIYLKNAGQAIFRAILESREQIEPLRVEHERYLQARNNLGN